ncbi:MAG: ferric anguibactin-binding protein [Pseudomonadales bacterium]|nr:ferric anguibactin-binding protein [Pseudomonadales bacterium]|tara:strand:+ start:1006 stop:2010 length:1005 start_codon:yes stop_codon:yes gene_type:complete
MHLNTRPWALALLFAASALLHGCEQPTAQATTTEREAAPSSINSNGYQPVTVQHQLGTTVINALPQRVVALDMNEVDFLDLLEVPIAGMPKDFVPHFLAKYQDAPEILDTGAIVQPNLEKVHAARPDLILITSLQASHYEELSQIAPTIHFDVDYRDSQANHLSVVKAHLATLGRIFQKQAQAERIAAELDNQVEQVRQITAGRPDRALVVLHNNGAFSAFGTHSRYGFVFDAFGVQPAGPESETGLHGQPISSEFIQQTNPDVIYVVDRTAVMEQRPALNAETLANPLLRQTNAWKNDRVVFADAQAWYVTAASVNSLKLIMDDVIRGYPNPH